MSEKNRSSIVEGEDKFYFGGRVYVFSRRSGSKDIKLGRKGGRDVRKIFLRMEKSIELVKIVRKKVLVVGGSDHGAVRCTASARCDLRGVRGGGLVTSESLTGTFCAQKKKENLLRDL